MQVFSTLGKWAAHPYSSDMSVGGWLAFIGLIIVALILWSSVIRLIGESA